MKLLFKQRFFSWFDSYDIYDEAGNTVYVVRGQLSWGHCLKIFDPTGSELGTVKQRVFTLPPKSLTSTAALPISAASRRNSGCSATTTTSIATAGMWRATGWAGIIPLQTAAAER